MRYWCLLCGFIAILLCCVPAYAASGSIGAGQPTAFRSDGTCSIILSWGTSGVSAAEVWVFPAAGSSQKLFTGTQGSQQLDWIQALPQQYTFSLYTTVNGSRGTLLGSTTVAVSSTLSLNVLPSSSQSLNYNDNLNFTITVRDPSGNPMNGANVNIIDTTYGGAGRQFTVTTDSNGQTSYGYTINTLIAAGTYTLTFGPATKAGWNQSATLTRQVTVLAPPKFLTLDVQPSNNVNAHPGDSVTYTATVTDNNNNRIANATVPVFNPVTGNTSLTTNGNGIVSYFFTVPSATQSNTYTITFGQASASGYAASGYVQRTLTVAGQTPVLTLDVQPTNIQAALPGQNLTYTLTVRDGSNNLIQGATVTITNPFTGFNSNVTTDGNGSATYVLSVPNGQGTATYTVFFLSASKSGYTSSVATSRQVTVTQASSPTAVLSLAAQGQTIGNGGTLNLSVPSGGSVSVSFNASGCSAGSGTITAYEWRSNNSVISTQSGFTKDFGTPSNSITLTITNSFGLTSTASGLIAITIGAVTVPATPANPSPGSLSSPGPTMSSSSVTFSWSASSGATYYGVGVRDIATNVLMIDTNVSGTSYTANLAAGKPYRWNVDACNTAGCSSFTTPLYFQTPGASVTSLSVAPNSGPLGTALRFTGIGFAPGSTATLNVTRPDSTPGGGGVYGTDGNGSVSFVITSQSADPLGQWTFRLTDGTGKSASTTAQYTATQQTGTDAMTFVADVNVFDNTQITAGSNFTKTWRLKNSGTTTWNNYTAVFISNPSNGNPSTNLNAGGAVSVPVQTTSPDQTIDFSISMKALPPGTYYSYWQLQNTSGGRFGVQFYVKIRVVAQQGNTLGFGTQSGRQGTNDSPPAKSARNADPVNTATGNYNYAATDLRVPGRGLDVEIARSYNSQDITSGPLGNGWSYTFNIYLTNITATSASVHYSDGKVLDYVNQAGTNNFTSTYPGYYDALVKNGDGSWTLKKTDQRNYQFDTSGKLAAIQDRNNNRISLGYSGGNLSQVTDTVGRTFIFTYSGSLLTGITDPGGRNLQFTYDAGSNLISFRDANGNTNTYSYDSNNRLLKIVDGRGNNLVGNEYDSSNRVATQTNGRGNQWTFVYNSDGSTSVSDPFGKETKYLQDTNFNIQQTQDRNVSTQFASGPVNMLYDERNNRAQTSDAKGNYAAYVYDQNGNITNRTDPTLNSRTVTYDSKNNPTQITDELGKRTQMSYDSNGNLTRLTDALSNSASTTYDSFGEPLSTTDANGNLSMRTYDVQGNLTSVKDVLNNTTTYTYDGVGRRMSMTDARGKTTRYTYDGNDNLLTVTDPLNNVTSYSYDANNNRTSMLDARGNTTTYVYNENNSLIKEIDAKGNFTQHTYDKLDRQLTTRDKRGNTTNFTYDNEGRLVAVTDPLGNTTGYTYDANGNRTKITDAKSQSTNFTYDALNRVTKIQDALGNTIQKDYDAAGRLSKETDPRGNATQFAYDAIGNLTQVTDAVAGTVKYSYDKNRNRITQTDPNNHASNLAYDKLNRLLSTTDPLNHASGYTYDEVGNRISQTDAKGQITRYTFDANNRFSVITYPDNSTNQFTRDANGNMTGMVDSLGTSIYVYDELNRLISSTDPFGKTIGYQYDENGNISKLIYPDGKQVSYRYDPNNRMASLADWAAKTTSFQYDSRNLLTKVTYPNGIVTSLTYDNAGRLSAKSDSGISSYTFTLDNNGNRTSASVTQPLGNKLTNASQSYTYDAGNGIQNAGPATFGFDANGNMTGKTEAGVTTSYEYDFENRLVSVSGSSRYSYNGQGVRLQKIEGTKATRYIVDANHDLSQVVGETDANGVTTAYYVYGVGLAYKVNPDGTHYYYSFDPIGSTIAMTDDAKNVVNSYAYDPFGKVTSNLENTPNPFKFVGQLGLMDDGNGLTYVRARYYSPAFGRFLTRDPIAGRDNSPQSLNRYTYAIQNPILNVDPSGALVMSLGIEGDAFLVFGGSLQGAIVTDDQGHHGLALSYGVSGGFAYGVSASLVLSVTGDRSIFEMNEKSYSIGGGGGFLAHLSGAVLLNKDGRVNGVSLGVGTGIDLEVKGAITWGKVVQINSLEYGFLLALLGPAGDLLRDFDRWSGTRNYYQELINEAARQRAASTVRQQLAPVVGPIPRSKTCP